MRPAVVIAHLAPSPDPELTDTRVGLQPASREMEGGTQLTAFAHRGRLPWHWILNRFDQRSIPP